MRAGIILFLLSLLASTMLSLPIITIIIVAGLSTTLYAMFGGIQAVVWTDAIQAIILILGALFCLIVILIDLPGGMTQVLHEGSMIHKFSLGDMSFDLKNSSFWCVLIYGLFINLQNYGIDQNYIQRYMTSASEREAKKSAVSGSLLYIPVSLLFVFIGTALFVYYKEYPHLLPEGLLIDQVFPYFIAHQLPIGLKGFLMASIFAAGMSTISTSINSLATVILTDFVTVLNNTKMEISAR